MSAPDPVTTDTAWVIVEPGVLVLPTTGYEIRFDKEFQCFGLWHDGVDLGLLGSILSMKINARIHMRDLMAAGVEP